MGTALSDLFTDPNTFAPVGKLGGTCRVAFSTMELAVTDLAAGDIIMLARLPSDARVFDIRLWHDSLGATLTVDCGVYLTNGNVVDADGFADGVDLSGTMITSVGTPIRFQAGASGGFSNVDTHGKTLWELVGASDNSAAQYDICLTVATSGTPTAGTLTFWILYTTS